MNKELFDQYGRCIPENMTQPVHEKTRRYFLIEQDETDYERIYHNIDENFHIQNIISLAEFTSRSEKIIADLALNPDIKNITNGTCVPFVLPPADYPDIGKAMDDTFIPALRNSFKAQFPEYQFINHSVEKLSGKLSVIEASRHEELIKRMKEELLVACYFPCLTEYSLPAMLEKIQQLPENFLLAGGYDTVMALVGSPGLLHRKEGYPPLLWFPALATEKSGEDYYFEAYGFNLTFNQRVHFNKAAESWAGGLVVLG